MSLILMGIGFFALGVLVGTILTTIQKDGA